MISFRARRAFVTTRASSSSTRFWRALRDYSHAHGPFFNVIQFQHTHDGVTERTLGTLVHETTLQAGNDIFHNCLQTKRTERTKSHSTNRGIIVTTIVIIRLQTLPILFKRVNSKNSQILVLLSIGYKELVSHLLDNDILSDRNLFLKNCTYMYHNYRSEELGHIDSHCREVDYTAHHLTQFHHILLDIGIVQQL